MTTRELRAAIKMRCAYMIFIGLLLYPFCKKVKAAEP